MVCEGANACYRYRELPKEKSSSCPACPKCGSTVTTLVQPQSWHAPTCVCSHCDHQWTPPQKT